VTTPSTPFEFWPENTPFHTRRRASAPWRPSCATRRRACRTARSPPPRRAAWTSPPRRTARCRATRSRRSRTPTGACAPVVPVAPFACLRTLRLAHALVVARVAGGAGRSGAMRSQRPRGCSGRPRATNPLCGESRRRRLRALRRAALASSHAAARIPQLQHAASAPHALTAASLRVFSPLAQSFRVRIRSAARRLLARPLSSASPRARARVWTSSPRTPQRPGARRVCARAEIFTACALERTRMRDAHAAACAGRACLRCTNARTPRPRPLRCAARAALLGSRCAQHLLTHAHARTRTQQTRRRILTLFPLTRAPLSLPVSLRCSLVEEWVDYSAKARPARAARAGPHFTHTHASPDTGHTRIHHFRRLCPALGSRPR
jgi:hypothetical protein